MIFTKKTLTLYQTKPVSNGLTPSTSGHQDNASMSTRARFVTPKLLNSLLDSLTVVTRPQGETRGIQFLALLPLLRRTVADPLTHAGVGLR